LGLPPNGLLDRSVHFHVPSASFAEDGPSAGITLVTALASVLAGIPVRDGVGMTGEMTLQGQVLSVGGVKHKVLAAHRHGLKTVIMPRSNEADLEDVPQRVREELTFILVDHVDEVLDAVLPAPVEFEVVTDTVP
jgi:ATP-dependent Lon protease